MGGMGYATGLLKEIYGRVKGEVQAAKAIFSQAQGQSQGIMDDKNRMYYSVQSWLIILVTVYKYLEHNYDPVRRRYFRKLCVYLSN